MNLFIPIILIIISVGSFFTFINPEYQEIKSLQEEMSSYEDSISDVDTIKNAHLKLSNIRNDLLKTDRLDKLDKFLPDHINNIDLILDVTRIARESSIVLSDINLSLNQSTNDKKNNGIIEVSNENKYNSAVLSFSFVSNYSNFKKFIADIRKSLRLLDVVSISINPQVNLDNELNGNFEYKLKVRSYWLENK